MAKSVSFGKRENEKKKISKRLEKQQRKEQRKIENQGKSFDDMIAYVDENGVITSTPPEVRPKEEINLEDIVISTPKKGEVEEDPIHKGRVDHFNESKGYGFIKDLANNEKYFFHVSHVTGEIAEGDTVFFELEKGLKGLNATNITLEAQ